MDESKLASIMSNGLDTYEEIKAGSELNIKVNNPEELLGCFKFPGTKGFVLYVEEYTIPVKSKVCIVIFPSEELSTSTIRIVETDVSSNIEEQNYLSQVFLSQKQEFVKEAIRYLGTQELQTKTGGLNETVRELALDFVNYKEMNY